ncbi:MAG: hypothetical protein INR68_05225 [Methylobacterium mesophilicum]|nr:hypothetical protein [Methylobacterium mesophilicum]
MVRQLSAPVLDKLGARKNPLISTVLTAGGWLQSHDPACGGLIGVRRRAISALIWDFERIHSLALARAWKISLSKL